jgi:germination protein YpeB
MEASYYQVYDGLAVIHFAALQDGVLLYPDQLKLQIRMDTGEVVGLEAHQYLMNHTQRTNLAPALTQEQALESVSPQLAVEQVRLCVIPEGSSERLCYEITGTTNQQTYMVYIDAATGEEADVLMLMDGAEGPLAA